MYANKALDVWFEYVPEGMILTVNGQLVDRSSHWEFKLAHMKGIHSLNYTARNPTSQYQSYNLHMVPSTPGDIIQATVRQKWTN